MTRNRNAAHDTQPARTAWIAPWPNGGPTAGGVPQPIADGPARRRGVLFRRLALGALVAFGLVAGPAAQAALTASENPSTDGSYRISWTAVTGATKYQLLEDGTEVYEGTARSKSFTGKTAGSYAYTLTYCRYFPSPIGRTLCDLPSNFTALTVRVSSAPATPTPPAAPTLTVPATDTDGGYKVSWTSPAGATSYRLQEKTNNGSWGSSYSGTKTSKSYTGKATAGYSYRVKACAGASNCSGWSATESVRVTRAASVLSASANPAPYGNYTVRWTASSLGSYTLKESVDGATATTVYTGTGRSKSFSARAPGDYAYSLTVCFNLLGRAACVDVGSLTVTVPEPTGEISATPAPCVFATGKTRCSTKVTWFTENAAAPCVFVEGTRGRFHCSRSGSKTASSISASGTTFLLKAGNTFGSETLDSVTVRGVGEPTVSASFSPARINPRGKSTLTWSSTDADSCSGSPSIGSTATSGSKRFTRSTTGAFRVTVTCTGPGGSGSDTATLTVNRAPVATPDRVSTDYETQVTVAVLDNDTDADGDTLTVVSVSDPANGSTEIDDGATVTYTPDDGFSGKDAFNYAVSDGLVRTSAKVTVTVRAERVDPTAPGQPRAPTVTAPSATTLKVTWSAPADNGSAITDYDVQFRKTSVTDWTDHAFTGTGTSTTITGLDAYTTYAVEVRARNGAEPGTGAWSDETEQRTGDIVPNRPAAPTVTATDSSTLEVTWAAPVRRGSAVSDYDVQYRKASVTQWSNHAFTGAGTTTTIASLDADTDYLVRVRAANLKGESRWSAAGAATTAADTNRPPVAKADSAATLPGENVTIRVLDNDMDADAGDTLTVASATTPANGKAVVNPDGTVTYTPNAGFVGTNTFRYTVTDGTATATATVSVEVARFIAVPNPSADGNYEVKWAPVAGATQYLLLEEGTAAYLGPNRSRSFANKARGSYVYTLSGCVSVLRGAPSCRIDSGYGELAVQVGAPLPAAPASLTATPNPSADGSFRVSWSASTGATRYQLQERQAGDWSGVHDGTATRTDISGRSITGAAPYRYRVRGCAGSADAACGRWSSEMSVAITGTVIAIPNPSTDGSYMVRWTPSPVATRYKLDESTDGGATWPTVYTVTGTQRAFAGKADDTYTYRVRACFDLTLPLAGSRETCAPLIPTRAGATFDVVVDGRLAPPTVTVTPEVAPNGGYRVSWPSSAGARSYVLQERTDGGQWSTVTGVTGRAKSFTGRAVAVYDYQVQACATSTDCGAWSPAATVRVPPAAPANLRSTTPDGNGDYVVSWDASTGADRYVLEESADAGGTWSALAKQSSDADRSRAVDKAAAGTFHYRVKACQGTDNCGASSGSIVVEVTMSTLPVMTLPEVPADCQPTRYLIEWSEVADATRYELQQRTGNGDWSFVYRSTGTSTKRTLDVGTTYSFRARSCRTGAGCTAWGVVATFVAPHCVGVPRGFGVDPTAEDDYTVEWNAVTNAARYELERSTDGVKWTNVQNGTALSRTYENETDGTYRYPRSGLPGHRRLRRLRRSDLGDRANPAAAPEKPARVRADRCGRPHGVLGPGVVRRRRVLQAGRRGEQRVAGAVRVGHLPEVLAAGPRRIRVRGQHLHGRQ